MYVYHANVPAYASPDNIRAISSSFGGKLCRHVKRSICAICKDNKGGMRVRENAMYVLMYVFVHVTKRAHAH